MTDPAEQRDDEPVKAEKSPDSGAGPAKNRPAGGPDKPHKRAAANRKPAAAGKRPGGPNGPRAAKRRAANAGAAPAAATPVPLPRTDKETIKRLRRQRTQRLAARFGIFVLLPTLVATIYYSFVASDQYESYAQFTVHSAEAGGGANLEGLLGMAVGSPTAQDTLVVRDYILSRDMLALLEEEHQLVEHFKDPSVDFVSRFADDATFEEIYEDYEDIVNVEYDSTSGNLTLRVRAFTPAKSAELAKAVIANSEAMVNELTKRERRDRTAYAEEEVEKCEQRLTKARKQVLELQQKHGDFNPEATASASMSIRTGLEAELAKARAELMQAKSFMKDSAPKVRALRDRVKALSAQVGHEKQRLVDPKGENGIANSLAEFEEAVIEKEFAEKSYGAALSTLEMARADAARQHRYLAVIARPSMPDESTYPERAWGVFTVFVVSFLLLGIGSLLVAAVREHAQV